MNTLKTAFILCLLVILSPLSYAQISERLSPETKDSIQIIRSQFYNSNAGVNAPLQPSVTESGDFVRDRTGNVVYQEPQKDSYGNAQGNQYDLAIDGAFKGQTILVLQLYYGLEPEFDFEDPKKALEQKGFSIYRYISNPPSPEQLKKDLEKSCQLWIISDSHSKLNEEHLKVIKEYFDNGHGIYIWGDNEPYYADANKVAQYLFGGSMAGNLMGDHPVGMQTHEDSTGVRKGHDLTTGLQTVYEGITIATLAEHQDLTPILYGSAGNLVTAAYEKNGKRAILDGGFTRLYIKWETAGTDRYIKNAAAWLVNIENVHH